MAPIANPPPDTIARIEFREAEYYLTQMLKDFDPDPLFAGAILSLLIQDAMAYADKWDSDRFLDSAVCSIEQAVPNNELAFEIARQASDLINQQLSAYLDDFSSVRYGGKYTYNFIGEANGIIQINYWHAGVPGGRAPSEAAALL